MTTIINKSTLDLEYNGEARSITSNLTFAYGQLDFTVNKSVSCGYFLVGSILTYCTQIMNSSDVMLEGLRWFDVLEDRLSYVENSFTVSVNNEDPTEETPDIDGQELGWDIGTLGGGELVTICFKAKVGESRENGQEEDII